LARRLCRADIGLDRNIHADEAGRARKQGADQEADRRDGPKEVKDDCRDDHANDSDRRILAGEIGARAFLDGAGNILHPLRARGLLEHLQAGHDSVKNRQQATGDGQFNDQHSLTSPNIWHRFICGRVWGRLKATCRYRQVKGTT